MDETVKISVQEDGSRVVESNLNAVAAAGDKADASMSALQKIMAQVTSVMDKVATSVDRLNSTLDKQTTSAQKVAAAQSAAAKAVDAMSGSSQASATAIAAKTAATEAAVAADGALAESEAQATTRIQAMVAASLEQVAAQQAVAASSAAVASASTAAAEAQAASGVAAKAAADGYASQASAAVRQIQLVEQLDDAVTGNIKSIGAWRDIEGQLVAAFGSGTLTLSEFQQMTAKLDAQLPNLTASIAKEQAAITALTSKYDPLNTKMEKLAADELALQKARDTGILSVKSYEAAMAGLAAEQAAVQAALNGTSEAETAHAAVAGLNARATRELGTVMEEVATGNVGRLKTSLGALANSTGLLAKLISPLGLSLLGLVAIIGTLVAGVISGYEQFQKLNAALIITGDTSGVTAGQIQMMSESMASANVNAEQTYELLTGLVGTGKTTSESLGDVGKAAQNMLALTGDSVNQVVQDFSKLYDDPVKWAEDMDTKWHFLTLDVKDHAQELINVGDKYGAAEVVAAAFADNTKTKVDQLNASMGTLATLIQRWQQGVANIKGFVFDIGKPDDLTQQFVKAREAYTDFVNQFHNGQQMANGDQYVANQLWQKMYDLQQQVIGQRAGAKAAQDADQQRQATLAAAKSIDAVNDSTQKQITMQTKLNQLTAAYQQLHKTNPNDARLQGVTFDSANNPAGGSYDSKYGEIVKEYSDKTKTPRVKVDNSAEKQLEAEEKAWDNLLNTIDPVRAATEKFSDAQHTLAVAVQQGWMTQEDANTALATYKLQLQDSLDPLAAFEKKINDQITALQQTGKATDSYIKAKDEANALLKQGVVVGDDWIANTQKQYDQIERLTAQQQIYQQIQKSVINQTKTFADQLAVVQALEAKGAGNGGITQQQGDQYLVKQNPDLFAGTQKQLQVQLAQYQTYYAQIEEMDKEGFINQSDRITMLGNIERQMLSLRLQSTMSFLGTVAELQNSSNKKVAMVGKAAAIAQATVNTYTAATAAYQSAAAIPFVGWILGPIAAAAAVAAGLVQVQKIRSTSYGNGFMTGGYTGNMATTAIAGAVHGQEYVMDASTTSRLGKENLDALRAGTLQLAGPGQQQGQQAPVIVQPGDVNVAVVSTHEAALTALRSQAGKKVIIDTINENPNTVRNAVNSK